MTVRPAVLTVSAQARRQALTSLLLALLLAALDQTITAHA